MPISPDVLATKIRDAAAAYNFDEVIFLIDQHPGIDLTACVDSVDDKGNTALIWAVQRENEAAVDVLIKAGAKVNAKNNTEGTALLEAVLRRHGPMVKRLVDAGADTNTADAQGIPPLMRALPHGPCTLIDQLIEAGAAVNHRATDGRTALIRATALGRLSVVILLLAKSANPMSLTMSGKTALDVLGQQNFILGQKAEIASVLIPAMFDPCWWQDKSPAEVRAAWDEVPREWRPMGLKTLNVLSRQFERDHHAYARTAISHLSSPLPGA